MENNINIGRSLYFSEHPIFNLQIMEKSADAKIKYLFSSLNINEIEYDYSDIYKIIEKSRDLGQILILDINKVSAKRFDLCRMKEKGLTHIRIDDGLSENEILELSKEFTIVLNASTLSIKQLNHFKKKGLPLDKMIACHNYYPKLYTGLNASSFQRINEKLKKYGFRIMSFVPGDKILRGPMNEGLPTIEDHRYEDIAYSILDSRQLGSEIVMIGDIEIQQKTYEQIQGIQSGYLLLHGKAPKELKKKILFDRVDHSSFFLRSSNTRGWNYRGEKLERKDYQPGDILYSNQDFKRYHGEIEIVKKQFPRDPRRDIIGKIQSSEVKYLKFASHEMGIKLI